MSLQLLQMLLHSEVQAVKTLIGFIPMHLFPVEFFLLHNVESCLSDKRSASPPDKSVGL